MKRCGGWWRKVASNQRTAWHWVALALCALTYPLAGCKHSSFGNDAGSGLAGVTQSDVNFHGQDTFFFGLATAPAHVENDLHDAWLDFARAGGVVAWKNQSIPEKRLNFWDDPDTEINLAAATGVTVFRMGVDWGRLVASRGGDLDPIALQRYKVIIDKIRAKNMRVMLTLFHHSLPRWALDKGGWTSPDIKDAFIDFSKKVVGELKGKVDYWVTFNEPAVFAALVHAAGIWPGGGTGKPNPLAMLMIPGVLKGDYYVAIDNMTEAHNTLYDAIHAIDTGVTYEGLMNTLPTKVGVAHNIGHHIAKMPTDLLSVLFARVTMNYLFLDATIEKSDFIGINYYGSELLSGASVSVNPNLEYSESGRIVNPSGLYRVIKDVHHRYNELLINRTSKVQIPFIITENGISDNEDILRPAYLVEHLRAVDAAIKDGIPVLGYVFWTISDNWEWADGYCPKFGLVAVDRAQNLQRTKRPSYALFSGIVKNHGFTAEQADKTWQQLVGNFGKPRSFCRNADGKTSVDTPYLRNVVKYDWRFSKDKVLTIPGGGPYEMNDDMLNAPVEMLDEFKNNDGVKLLSTFIGAYDKLTINVINHRSITYRMTPSTYIRCNHVVNGFIPIQIYFDNTFSLNDIRQENGRWVADLTGLYVKGRKVPMPLIAMKKIYLDGTLASFDYNWSVLNRMPPIDLSKGRTPSCSTREKGPNTMDFY